jgi:DNA helicase-2/ATP-dependent DNA helicase PcrA
MTLHAAKGLEFPVVAMIGLEEGILPHNRSRGNMNELEEERRLCFVGITRAQERLILSKAASRTIRGLTERTIPSPFINELPEEDIALTDRTGIGSFPSRRAGGRPTAGGGTAMNLGERNLPKLTGAFANFRAGQLVRHPKFGLGRIRELEKTGDERTRAVVQFNEGGLKTLYLEFAQLDVVE